MINGQWKENVRCKHSGMGGDLTSAVFSAPLNGGSSDEWVTGSERPRDRCEAISFLQL